jgi:multicomponent Na+:H+ antiporter subunit D
MQNHPAIYTLIASLSLLIFAKNDKAFKFIAVTFPVFVCLVLPFLNESLVFDILGNSLIANFSLSNRLVAISFLIVTLGVNIYATWQGRKHEVIVAGFYLSFSLICTFSGDFISMIGSLELMIITASILIFNGGSPVNSNVTKQYLLTHLFSGSLILLGISYILVKFGNIQIIELTQLFSGNATNLIIYYMMLTGCLINVAAVPFTSWLINCYPQSSSSGFIYLMTFTTKVSVITLIKLFYGLEFLKFFGVAMILYGSIYAYFENNIRRLLCYLTIAQLGIILVAIAYSVPIFSIAQYLTVDIIYKALLGLTLACLNDNKNIKNCSELIKIKSRLLNFSLASCLMMMVSFPYSATFLTKILITNNIQIGYLYYLISYLPMLILLSLPIKQFLGKDKPIIIKLNDGQTLSIKILLTILFIINIAIIYNHNYSTEFTSLTYSIIINSGKQILILSTGFLFSLFMPSIKTNLKRFDFDILIIAYKIINYFSNLYFQLKKNNDNEVDYEDPLPVHNYLNKFLLLHNQATAISVIFIMLIIFLITLIRN